jgi:hypothetical protein
MAKAKKKRAPKKRAPKRKAKKTARRAPRPRARKRAAQRMKPVPSASPSRKTVVAGGAGLGALLAGGLAMVALHHHDGAPPAPPKPAPGPAPSPAPTPAPAPAPSGEAWSDDHQTLNTLAGYHRAKQAEVNASAVAMTPSFLTYDIGPPAHYFTAGGTDYAAAVEMHQNPSASNPLPHPHKGVSVFVKDGSKVTRNA